MAQQHGLVKLGLAEPAGLLCGEEDLDGDVLAAPLALPHLTVATLADALDQRDLLGDRSLNLHAQTVYALHTCRLSEVHVHSLNLET